MGNRTIAQDADDNQYLKGNLPPVSALLSAFIGASLIFYALCIANFDDREGLGILRGIFRIRGPFPLSRFASSSAERENTSAHER
jgi:hypothetical protein